MKSINALFAVVSLTALATCYGAAREVPTQTAQLLALWNTTTEAHRELTGHSSDNHYVAVQKTNGDATVKVCRWHNGLGFSRPAEGGFFTVSQIIRTLPDNKQHEARIFWDYTKTPWYATKEGQVTAVIKYLLAFDPNNSTLKTYVANPFHKSY